MSDPTHPAQLTIERCHCAYDACQTYGFKEGTFYQGSGFEKETAERIATSYNVTVNMDDPKEVVDALISLARDVSNLTLHHPRLVMQRADEILSHIRS